MGIGDIMQRRSRAPKYGAYHSPWCEYTVACMQRAEVSGSEIARQLNIPTASVQAYLTGKVRPPLHLLTAWSKRLRLTIEEHVQFRRLAFFAHTEPEVVQWLQTAEQIVKDLQAKLKGAHREVRVLAMEVQESKAVMAGDG